MTIRYCYLYDFKRACQVERRIKIRFFSTFQVMFQEGKRRKLALIEWKLTNKSLVWPFEWATWMPSSYMRLWVQFGLSDQ